jgi:8-oxo-dGTP pyrophosphatase MutT (NUDIX family)
MPQPWPKVRTQNRGVFSVFSIREDRKVSPRTGREHDFYVLDCVDWVNVVALTADGKLVLVEQFRHGTEAVELEIPGGVMDKHEADPVATAVRELREETGYEGRDARLLGSVRPNPAIMSNTCHVILIEDCRLAHPVEFDHGEDIVTHLFPVDEVFQMVAAGKIRHSLVVVALAYFDLWRRGLKRAG